MDSNPYSEFARLSLPMIFEEGAHDVGGAPKPESTITKYYIPSDFDASSTEGLPYPVRACSFSILSLYHLHFSIHLATCTRMSMFYETQ